MKDCKIKEIIENNIFCISEAEGDYEEVANAMKEYAEFCMKGLCSELQLYGDLHEDFAVNSLIQKILNRK